MVKVVLCQVSDTNKEGDKKPVLEERGDNGFKHDGQMYWRARFL